MASVTITRGTTLPNSSAKSDFHNLVDTATGVVTNIVNADIDSAAAIADTKLATISTSGKVTGASLTGFPSIPSGAGVIPIANLASGTPTGSKFIRDDGTLQSVTVPISATQTEIEAVTSDTAFATPLNMKWHPGVAKAWVYFTGSSGAILASHNVTSVTDVGTGDNTVNLTSALSATNNAIIATAGNYNLNIHARANMASSSTIKVGCYNTANSVIDADVVSVVVFGDF